MASISLQSAPSAATKLSSAPTRSWGVFSAFHSARALVHTWRERARSRRELALIEPWVRRDLCLNSCDIQYEIYKPFWRE